jgi:hypothetical protein
MKSLLWQGSGQTLVNGFAIGKFRRGRPTFSRANPLRTGRRGWTRTSDPQLRRLMLTRSNSAACIDASLSRWSQLVNPLFGDRFTRSGWPS